MGNGYPVRLPLLYGVVTREQARAAGLKAEQIDDLVASREWKRLHRGVYLAGDDHGFVTNVAAAALATNGVVSSRTAAAILKIDGFQHEESIHITVDHRTEAKGIHSHVVPRIDPAWTQTVGGLPMTSWTRTLVDLGRDSHIDELEGAIDFCIRKKKTNWIELEILATTLPRSGSRAAAALRRVLILRKNQRVTLDSLLETHTNQLFRYAELPPPMLQFTIYDGKTRIARVDFIWPDENLIVEVVGYYAHAAEIWQFERDAQRSTSISRLKRYTVFTFTWRDVHETPMATCALVAEVLGLKWNPSKRVRAALDDFSQRFADTLPPAREPARETSEVLRETSQEPADLTFG